MINGITTAIQKPVDDDDDELQEVQEKDGLTTMEFRIELEAIRHRT